MTRSRLTDLSASAVTAGFVAALVGFTSSVAIVFEAARSLGATPQQAGSWMWALGWGMGLASLVPSLWWRKPVLVAWSTPGAAVLAAAGAGGRFGIAEATGAFLVSALLVLAVAASGVFEKLMARIPPALAGALLAGVLARFAIDAFAAVAVAPLLVGSMLAAWLVGRRLWPRYVVIGVLAIGIAVAAAQGSLGRVDLPAGPTLPVLVLPAFSWQATVTLALPLFVVTMASQNLPGVAAIRAAGYALPVSALLAITAVATLLLAPFGAFALSLAAITAAIVMGREAHADPSRRWVAAAACGIVYCVVGTFGGAVAGGLAAFPRPLIAAVAGIALIGTIAGALMQATADAAHREAAAVTFLVALSGIVLGGIGAAFWAVVAGAAVLFVQHWRLPAKRVPPPSSPP